MMAGQGLKISMTYFATVEREKQYNKATNSMKNSNNKQTHTRGRNVDNQSKSGCPSI